MKDIQHNAADIVRVPADDTITAVKFYDLSPLLFEYIKNYDDRNKIVAVTKQKIESHKGTLAYLQRVIKCKVNELLTKIFH